MITWSRLDSFVTLQQFPEIVLPSTVPDTYLALGSGQVVTGLMPYAQLQDREPSASPALKHWHQSKVRLWHMVSSLTYLFCLVGWNVVLHCFMNSFLSFFLFLKRGVYVHKEQRIKLAYLCFFPDQARTSHLGRS